MLIVGVDVGITHLGLAELDTGPDGSDRRVGALALVDIMLYGSDGGDAGPVELYDRLDAFARDHDRLFSRADVVAIERQPLVGLQCVQLFFLSRWRRKCVLVSPNTLHRRFLPTGLDYDERKAAMERVAHGICADCGVDWAGRSARWVRRHDVADALAICVLHAEAEEASREATGVFDRYRLVE